MDLDSRGTGHVEVAMIGLGRTGASMALRLVRGGHLVRAHDPDPASRQRAARAGIFEHATLADLTEQMAPPRILWLMVPTDAATEATLRQLAPLLQPGDTLVDGGNAYYRDSMRRHADLARRGIRYVDCGTSGALGGLQQGYGMMVGGDAAVIRALRPIFETLAPGRARGWGRVGPSGAGHYAVMIRNGIEYGLIESCEEGFSLLQPRGEFALESGPMAAIWRYAAALRSWLPNLGAPGRPDQPVPADVGPCVEDPGAGRWTVAGAARRGIAAPLIARSLYERLRRCDNAPFSEGLLLTLRKEFGGPATGSR
jgi:6-phosphogluconate dehydrogenase